jgi:hypothetical protein
MSPSLTATQHQQYGLDATRANGFGVRDGDTRDTRIDTASAALRVARVASASRKRLMERPLLRAEQLAVETMRTSLQAELEIVRKERQPSRSDDAAFALADLALSAFLAATGKESQMEPDAVKLDRLVALLEKLLSGSEKDRTSYELSAQVFDKASEYATADLQSTGEEVNEGSAVLCVR